MRVRHLGLLRVDLGDVQRGDGDDDVEQERVFQRQCRRVAAPHVEDHVVVAAGEAALDCARGEVVQEPQLQEAPLRGLAFDPRAEIADGAVGRGGRAGAETRC